MEKAKEIGLRGDRALNEEDDEDFAFGSESTTASCHVKPRGSI